MERAHNTGNLCREKSMGEKGGEGGGSVWVVGGWLGVLSETIM